jgi:hypothetical protein
MISWKSPRVAVCKRYARLANRRRIKVSEPCRSSMVSNKGTKSEVGFENRLARAVSAGRRQRSRPASLASSIGSKMSLAPCVMLMM